MARNYETLKQTHQVREYNEAKAEYLGGIAECDQTILIAVQAINEAIAIAGTDASPEKKQSRREFAESAQAAAVTATDLKERLKFDWLVSDAFEYFQTQIESDLQIKRAESQKEQQERDRKDAASAKKRDAARKQQQEAARKESERNEKIRLENRAKLDRENARLAALIAKGEENQRLADAAQARAQAAIDKASAAEAKLPKASLKDLKEFQELRRMTLLNDALEMQNDAARSKVASDKINWWVRFD